MYVADLESSILRPKKELKASKKARLLQGRNDTCQFALGKYSVPFRSEQNSQWVAEAGEFAVTEARSADPRHEVLRETF